MEERKYTAEEFIKAFDLLAKACRGIAVTAQEAHDNFFNNLENEKPENQPTIVKSGETWVAEYQGVDYLCMYPKTWEGVAKDIEGEVFIKRLENNMKGSYGSWKPISKIKITDDVAKLRPMVHLAGSQGINRELYAVVRDVNCIIRAGIHKASAVEIHDCRLATVKDLTEGV